MIRAARLRLALPTVAVTAVLLVCAVCQAGSTNTFPLGIYCVGPDQLSVIGTTKFNLVVNPYWAQGKESSLRYLESCWKHGKRGTPGFDTQKIKSRDAAYLREYVHAMKDHPALFAYYLSDEPSMVGVTPEAATFAYQAIKAIDPTRPVLVSHFKDARAYKPAYDVLCFDQYPIGTMTIARYRQLFRDVVGEVQPKPVWAVIQAFGAGKDWKNPMPEEQRCMTYLTIANGAQGILFYMYGRRGDSYYMGDHPDQWDFARKLAEELDGFASVLQAETSPLRVVVESKHVDVLLKQRGDRLYLIAVNWASGTPRMDGHYPGIPLPGVRVVLPGVDKAVVRLVGQAGSGSAAAGRELTVVGGQFIDSFDPYAVHIYEIRPLPSKS